MLTGDQDGYTTLSSIIEFFVQKYKEDAAFAQRVDASVLRILTAKQGMYASFTIKDVLPDQLAGGLGDVSDKTTFTVAQNAVTLISPSLHEIDTILPSAPMRYEDLIILQMFAPFGNVQHVQLIIPRAPMIFRTPL